MAGGGYTKNNVARCWTNETAILVGQHLADELPPNAYSEYYQPGYRLDRATLSRKPLDNYNTRARVDQIRETCMEYLRHLAHTPGEKALRSLPPGLLWSPVSYPASSLAPPWRALMWLLFYSLKAFLCLVCLPLLLHDCSAMQVSFCSFKAAIQQRDSVSLHLSVPSAWKRVENPLQVLKSTMPAALFGLSSCKGRGGRRQCGSQIGRIVVRKSQPRIRLLSENLGRTSESPGGESKEAFPLTEIGVLAAVQMHYAPRACTLPEWDLEDEGDPDERMSQYARDHRLMEDHLHDYKQLDDELAAVRLY